MIESIYFRNFRVLEQARLPLGQFNLLLGPNGSGKTTAVRALLALGETARAMRSGNSLPILADLAGAASECAFGDELQGSRATLRFDKNGQAALDMGGSSAEQSRLLGWLSGIRGYVLDPAALARPVSRDAPSVLASNGAGLPAVLAALRNTNAEKWEEYLGEVRRLLPEVTDVVAGQTVNGQLAFTVTKDGGLVLHPENLSQGTLVILALVALSLAPERASFLCFEEIERGIHPRLLRDIRDTLYRLSFPADWGDSAPAAQVLTTTHSPYVLDLFSDTPEDVVLATIEGGAAVFKRLADMPELQEALENGRLGDLWYSGIFGGVP